MCKLEECEITDLPFPFITKNHMHKVGYLALVAVTILFSCDPPEEPIRCYPDSINHLDGIIFNGHITLCNAQGPDLVYETAVCSLTIKTDTAIFSVLSTNPNFHYYHSDTLTSSCIVLEGTERVFNFYEFSSTDLMGYIHENSNNTHLIIPDSMCPTSSFFEGNN